PAAPRHPLRAGPGAVRLRGAAVAPRVPRPRARDLERLRHPAAGHGAVPRRSSTGGRLRAPGIAWRAVECRCMGRWDHLLDQKRRELKEYVLDKVAEQLAADLRKFPPPIEEWLDPALEARYAGVLTRVARPELETYRVACELAREEMLRE